MNVDSFLYPLQELEDCALCPRKCHADRIAGKLGYCKSDASFNIASICIHRGEEPVISGPNGICNIFFTNCNLQCIYCQNHQISDTHVCRTSSRMELEKVIRKITSILDTGINMVGFVSPSHFIPQMKIIINVVHSLGYFPKWVYNTNSYDSVETLKSLEGIMDVYLPDFKYLDPILSQTCSDAANYPEYAAIALKEMYRQKGSALHLSHENTIESGIIIRHLVLPGAVMNSIKILRFIAQELSSKIFMSMMSQYYPTRKVNSHHFLNRKISKLEYQQVLDEMENLEMYNGWVQEFDSNEYYRPDFNKSNPFEE